MMMMMMIHYANVYKLVFKNIEINIKS